MNTEPRLHWVFGAWIGVMGSICGGLWFVIGGRP